MYKPNGQMIIKMCPLKMSRLVKFFVFIVELYHLAGNMSLLSKINKVHKEACSAGRRGYFIPKTGLLPRCL